MNEYIAVSCIYQALFARGPGAAEGSAGRAAGRRFPRMNPPFGVKHRAIRSDTLIIAAFGPATLVRGRLGAAPGTKRGGPFLFLSIEAVVGFA
jgi:hypothetical protein